MNICFFADSRNVHIHSLAPALAARGNRVRLVCHKPVTIPGVEIERFSIPPAGLARPFRWHRRWHRYLRSFLTRFDVVVIFFLHDWGFTPELLDKGCLVASPRGSDIVVPPGENPPSPGLLANRIAILRHAALVGVSCPSFARTVMEFANLEPEQIGRLPLGVDTQSFRPRASPRTPTPESMPFQPCVGFLKGFRPVYGAETIVRAIPSVLDMVPSARFELVGDGPLRDTCRTLANELNVQDKVSWLSRRSHGEIPELLRGWDVSVIPSICESFGLAALESQATEVPVVAARVGGLVDTVRDGQTGLLVQRACPTELACAVVRLLENGDLRRRLGTGGRRFVSEAYEKNLVLDQWMRTLEHARDRTTVMV